MTNGIAKQLTHGGTGELIDIKALEAQFILLGLKQINKIFWFVVCKKDKKNKPYKSSIHVFSDYVTYKQSRYEKNSLSTLFRHIAQDMKGEPW